jgi:hypothetical protein
MIGPPVDSTALHAGLVVAAAAFLAVAGTLPARPAPDAAGVADTVDSVAAGDAPSSATHEHGADAVRLRPHGISMRNSRGTTRATFAFGPVVTVDDGKLRRVLDGEPPRTVFADRDAFRDTVEAAREREPEWIASDEIAVREVIWDGYRATLVGA